MPEKSALVFDSSDFVRNLESLTLLRVHSKSHN